METNNTHIGEGSKGSEAKTVKSLKSWFALPAIIAACKSLRTVTLIVGGLVMAVFLSSVVFGKEDPSAEFERLSKEQGSIEYQQAEKAKAANQKRSEIAKLQQEWTELQTRIDQINARKDELRPSFTQAGVEVK